MLEEKIVIRVPGRADYKTMLVRILHDLIKHRAECEEYLNGLIEYDADYITQQRAEAKLAGVEECIQFVRRAIDER